MITAKNNTIGTSENEVQKRKDARNRIKNTQDRKEKNRYRQEIIQSQINQKKQELEKKQAEIQEKKQQIKETYYKLIDNLILFYRQIGVIKTDKQINERFFRSPYYFQSSKKNNNMPKSFIFDEIIEDLQIVDDNLPIICGNIDLSKPRTKIKILKEAFINLKKRF